MIEENNRIACFLNKYIEKHTANYAVMLTGDWGVGKTYFIKKWSENLINEISKNKSTSISKPIYVSLFGYSTLEEINKAITREIYPFMKSKLYNIGTNVLQSAISSVGINCDLKKISKNKIKGNVDLEIDLVSLFKSLKSEKETGENRIIIFDDFERCKVSIDDLLGYINGFVEHSNIRVIIICNEEIVEREGNEETKKIYSSFKEKIVGRTFEISPDTDESIESFCQNSPEISFSDNEKNIVKDIFLKTKYNNLRLLFQSLQDFTSVFNKIDKYNSTNNTHIQIREILLAQYIVAYSEYHNSEEIRNQTPKLATDPGAIKFNILAGTSKEGKLREIIGKYDSLDDSSYTSKLLATPFYAILHSIKYGTDIEDIIKPLFIENKETIYNKLVKYQILEENEFSNTCLKALEYCKNGKATIQEIINLVGLLITISNIREFKTSDEEEIINNIDSILNKTNNTNIETLKDNFKNNSVFQKIVDVRFKNFIDSVRKLIDTKYNKIIIEEIKLLEEMSNNNFDRVIDIFFNHEFPDFKAAKYVDNPFFSRADPKKIANSLLKISNENKYKFGSRLVARYDTIRENSSYKGDLENLESIKEILEKESIQKDGLNKFCISNLIENFNSAIEKIQKNHSK